MAITLAAQLACSGADSMTGGGGGGGGGGGAALIVSPSIAAAAPNVAVQFAAQDHAGAAQPVTWRVNGLAAGSNNVGVVSSGGQYTAPATIPEGDSVVVSAVLSSDTTLQASSTIYFIPDLTTKDYFVPIPRVVDATRPGRTRILLVPPTGTTVTYLPVSGNDVALVPIGNGVLMFNVEAASALANYQTGTLHNVVGRLRYSGSSSKIANLSVNVRDATMPNVPTTALAADAQRSAYVLNLRVNAPTMSRIRRSSHARCS